MTDQRVRDLERDAAHGDLQAQVRLLLERVRIGNLTDERLRLAAYLGDEAARLALGSEAPPVDTGSVIGLVLGLKPYGPPAFNRAAATVARFAPDQQENPLFEPLLEWLKCPCDEHRSSVQRTTGELRLGFWDARYIGGPFSLTKRVVGRLASLASPRARVQFCPPPVGPVEPVEPLDLAPFDAAVRAAVVAALLPWALGTGDPVLDGIVPPSSP